MFFFFSTFAVRGVRCEWYVFMKACFVHTAVVWDEFILEDGMEERAKECSHSGERGEECGCGQGGMCDRLHGGGES